MANLKSRGKIMLVVAMLACATGCGGSGTPPSTQPTGPAPFDLTGKWSGTATDSSGPGQMTWQVTQQNGATFSGTLSMTDTTANVTGTGAVSGSVSASSVSFSLAIPAGGFGGRSASCTASASGTAQASSSQLTGTYAGSNSCSGAITSGQFTLSRQ